MLPKVKNTPPASEIRKHYYLDEYVVIAPKRGNRPFTISDKPKSGVSVKKSHLPIEDDPAVYEILGEDGQWAVKVVNNLYPALSEDNHSAYGRQEIVLETSQAGMMFSELPVEQIVKVFKTYQARVGFHKQDKKIKHISVFKNHGFEAGASLAHTHSQIIAIDFIPPAIRREAEVFKSLQKRFGASPLGAALEWEREQQVRVINNSLYVTAIAPYASRRPFEVWLIPHRPVASILELTDNELVSFARMLRHVTAALDSQKISYNFSFHEGQLSQHFMLKVSPRPNIWAGFEIDTDVVINTVAPEAAAKWYRKSVVHKKRKSVRNAS